MILKVPKILFLKIVLRLTLPGVFGPAIPTFSQILPDLRKHTLGGGLSAIVRTVLDEADDLIYFDDVVCHKVELASLPSDFSFARCLSPAGKSGVGEIQEGGRTISSLSLAALALNEACREMKHGVFLCMPGREERRPNACDLVFSAKGWNQANVKAWDLGNWADRLHLVQVGEWKFCRACSCLTPLQETESNLATRSFRSVRGS